MTRDETYPDGGKVVTEPEPEGVPPAVIDPKDVTDVIPHLERRLLEAAPPKRRPLPFNIKGTATGRIQANTPNPSAPWPTPSKQTDADTHSKTPHSHAWNARPKPTKEDT